MVVDMAKLLATDKTHFYKTEHAYMYHTSFNSEPFLRSVTRKEQQEYIGLHQVDLESFLDAMLLTSVELTHQWLVDQYKDEVSLSVAKQLYAQYLPKSFHVPSVYIEESVGAWEMIRLFELSDAQWDSVLLLCQALRVYPQHVMVAMIAAFFNTIADNEVKVGFTVGGENQERPVWLNGFVTDNQTFISLVKEVKALLPLEEELSLYHLWFKIPSISMDEERYGDLPDAVVSMRNDGSACFGGVKYSSMLFDSLSVELIVKHVGNFLSNLLEQPEARIRDVSYMDSEELAFILGCSGDEKVVSNEDSLYTTFLKVADVKPDDIAVICEDPSGLSIRMTYRELSDTVDRVAHRIEKLKLGPASCVGVYGERSIYSVISMLALFKLGLTYVPLDISYPESNLHHIIQDASLTLILTLESHVPFLHSVNIPHLVLDVIETDYEDEDSYLKAIKDYSNESLRASFIMYTSGSTGMPKGVRHHQQQLINFFNHMWTKYPFIEGDCSCQRTSMNFMPSMWEFLGGLLQGVPTVIMSDTTVRDPGRLIHALYKHEVTYCTMLPSMLRRIFETSEDLSCLNRIRVCMTVGEPFTFDLYKLFVNYFPDATLVVDYGATEVNGIMQFSTGDCDSSSDQMPWFKPITNVKTYILNPSMQLCPVGVPGDLYIGGVSLAVEYVNLEEETKAKFIENPLENTAEKRLYKMGDMARYLPDGRIQLLGRRDNQVKIHGIRMELSAIEHILAEENRIKECTVVAKEIRDGTKRLLAFVVIAENSKLTDDEIRATMSVKLPKYMIPSTFIRVSELPRTPSGKIDRQKLMRMDEPLFKRSTGVYGKNMEHVLIEMAAGILGGNEGEIKAHHKLYEIGFDSMTIVDFMNQIKSTFKVKLEVTDLYDHPSIQDLAAFLTSRGASLETCFDYSFGEVNTSQKAESSGCEYVEDGFKIAVIGLSCKFPGAQNVHEYWNNLVNGVSTITEIPKERWALNSFFDPDMKKPFRSVSKWGGFIDGIDLFDPDFFHISPREGEMMDPQHRLVLEECWKSLEDAGYSDKKLNAEPVGVFIGGRTGGYDQLIHDRKTPPDPYTTMGNDNAILAARVAYHLNLNGPCVTVDTACSSSLVAIHLACSSIRSGESRMAIAGGVSIITSPTLYYQSSSMGMFSDTGQCKAFDNDANGIVPGEGIGIVILKSYQRALEDGDHIYGTIVASGMNQDGKTNGITAPSAASQQRLIQNLYEQYQINPERITYVEAHGTGTKLGDPIEVKALTGAFRNWTSHTNYCAIGSVKTNIGHTITSSGVAGLIKVLMAMKNHKIPASLHFNHPNEHIDFAQSPFYVNTSLKEWKKSEGELRLAAVSSFGISGTNVHMVIEEAPTLVPNSGETLPYHIIPLSAKSESALMRKIVELSEWLDQEGAYHTMEEISGTLQSGRSHFHYRAACVVTDVRDLKQKLALLINGRSDLYLYTNREGTFSSSKMGEKSADQLWQKLTRDELDLISYKEAAGEVALFYTQGHDLDWELLSHKRPFRHISMPVYPFDRQRCWLPEELQKPLRSLQPFSWENVSTLKGQQYQTVFHAQNLEIKEHIIGDEPVLPAAVILEMIRAAGSLACEQTVSMIHSVNFRTAVSFDKTSKKIRIGLSDENNLIKFVLHEEGETGAILVCQGWLETLAKVDSPANSEPLEAIRTRCNRSITAEELYSSFAEKGMRYGASYQVVRSVSYNETELLALLELSHDLQQDDSVYTILPQIMDGAMHAMEGLDVLRQANSPYVPFSIGCLELYAPLCDHCYSYIHLKQDPGVSYDTLKADIEITNDQNELLLRIRDFVVRPLEGAKFIAPSPSKSKTDEVLLLENYWKEKPSVQGKKLKSLLVFMPDDPSDLPLPFSDQPVLRVKRGRKFKELSEDLYEVGQDDEDYAQLIKVLIERSFEISDILHLWALDRGGYLETSMCMESGIYSLYMLVRAIMHRNNGISNIRLTFAYSNGFNDALPYYAGVTGFLRTLSLEDPRFQTKSVCIDPEVWKEEKSGLLKLWEELYDTSEEREIHLSRHDRCVKRLRPFQITAEKMQYRGVYIITGGMGGIGYQLALHLLASPESNVILIGREKLVGKKLARFEQLRSFGNRVQYFQGDVTNYKDLRGILQNGREQMGPIKGVLHCAGVTHDGLLFHKDRQTFDKVLNPKVRGTRVLDELTASDPLDFFVMFSSIASLFGHIGQTDYAYANRYMDEFAALRQTKSRDGERSGKSLSIHWPFWSEGGMNLSAEIKNKLRLRNGMTELASQQGTAALEKALLLPESLVTVLVGDSSLLMQTIVHQGSMLTKESQESAPVIVESSRQDQASQYANTLSRVSAPELRKRVEKLLAGIVSKETHLPMAKCNPQRGMDEFGFNSLMIMNMTEKLGRHFGPLSQTLFFEHRNLGAFAEYLLKTYPDKVEGLFKDTMDKTDTSSTFEPTLLSLQNIKEDTIIKAQPAEENKIAIIGLSGHYPMARTLEEYWNNLVTGKDCITEIPEDRWDFRTFFDPDKREKGRSYTKWGGFLDDIDKFDPLFFNISPKEAELMDPQERLFLQCAWETLEDAGYTRKRLETAKVGVYVGVMWGQYQLYGSDDAPVEKPTSSYASIANRVSFVMNFKGPSMAIDTMCSSSLAALKLACDSLIRGETDYALAGGVNIASHPNKYILVSQGKFGSTDGRCRSFGEGGDGYVPGEGVGAVLLKPLGRAVQDGDYIYGVITGAALNHGGKTNGYTVPSPVSQASVLNEVFHQSQIHPRTISYLEAHGTGTALGDPIEINGISKAFSEFTEDKGFCSIGSVKSNIGHLESAAGIAALTKVLLQMQHRLLVPSIHSDKLNPRIDFAGSPVSVQRELAEWKQPVLMENGTMKVYPRRAGISSFGAGGSNAFLIVEEFINDKPEQANDISDSRDEPESLIVLSAINKDRLLAYVEKLRMFLKKCSAERNKVSDNTYAEHKLLDSMTMWIGGERNQFSAEDQLGDFLGNATDLIHFISEINREYNIEISLHEVTTSLTIRELGRLLLKKMEHNNVLEVNTLFQTSSINFTLHDLAYTLQIGREHFEERLAIVCKDFNALDKALEAYLQGKEKPGLYRGTISDDIAETGSSVVEENGESSLLWSQDRLEIIAEMWTKGMNIQWDRLQIGNEHSLVQLPTYPFDLESYWIDNASSEAKLRDDMVRRLHPLIDANVSTFAGMLYEKVFNRSEEYIKDHIIQGDHLVPGTAMIEMARAVGGWSKPGGTVTKIQNVVWLSPLVITEEPQCTNISLSPLKDQDPTTEFNIFSVQQETPIIHCKGTLVYGNDPRGDERLDLHAIRTRCCHNLSKDFCYSSFQKLNFQYGSSFKTLEELYYNENEALAFISLSEEIEWSDQVWLHPALLDGGLQSVIALTWNEVENELRLPYMIREIEIYKSLTRQCYVHTVRQPKGYSFTMTDLHGQVLVRVDGLSFRHKDDSPTAIKKSKEMIYVQDSWITAELEAPVLTAQGNLLIIDEDGQYPHLKNEIGKYYKSVTWIHAGGSGEQTSFGLELNLDDPDNYQKIFEMFRKKDMSWTHIIYLQGHRHGAKPDQAEPELVHRLALRLLYFTQAVEKETIGHVRVLLAYVNSRSEWESVCASAFVKSVCMENHRIMYKTVCIDDSALQIAKVLHSEVVSIGEAFQEVAYRDDNRKLRVLDEVDATDLRISSPAASLNKKRGRPVYVITGGLGGIGLIIARYLAASRACSLVLVGRSELTPEKTIELEELRKIAIDVLYMKADISNYSETVRLFEFFKKRFGQIHGIVHAAGVTNDSLLTNKTGKGLKAVLAAKVDGIIHLDRLSRREPLEFFVGFSSIAAVVGSQGQADYAFANRFMDMWIERRQHHVRAGNCQGTSLSINWSLWEEGGMGMHADLKRRIESETGISTLQTENALEAFEMLIASDYPRVTVIEGWGIQVRDWMRRSLGEDHSEVAISSITTDMMEPSLLKRLVSWVKGVVSKATKVPVDRIRNKDTFDKYGADSIMLIEMGLEVEKAFGTEARSVFIEFSTVYDVSAHLLGHYQQRALSFLEIQSTDVSKNISNIPVTNLSSFSSETSATEVSSPSIEKEAAVIGLSGRYPESDNTEQFWNHLIKGESCIREVPTERWNADQYYQRASNELDPLKISGKWGGFIRDVDQFDPLFFNISPREAENIDPQERIMLEVVWHALEKSGYSKAKLAEVEKEGGRVGVFIGAMYQPYPWVAKDKLVGAILSGSSYWSIANRISYFLGIHGPSMAVDTACSSSLTALHLAMNSLRSGECTMAIVGGVNLNLHAYKYVGLSQAKLLGSRDRSLSLGDGDGYLPGDGAGAVVLKMLAKAEADHDRILCKIKGSATNHNGRSSAYKVPSSEAQVELIQRAMEDADVTPDTISYIETASNGSSLGDAVEIDAIKRVFQFCRSEETACAIGSVKSNIGHLEAASGMSQLTKVILQFVHRKLVPTLHEDSLNPRIDLKDTVLHIQRQVSDWYRPKRNDDSGINFEVPLRVLINGFGAGGTNTALIVEEYLPKVKAPVTDRSDGPFLLFFSARSEERLAVLIDNFYNFYSKNMISLCLKDVAYSLSRREPMEERLALVVQNQSAALEALERARNGDFAGPDIFQSRYKTGVSYHTVQFIQATEDDLRMVAEHWVHGGEVDMEQLYSPLACSLLDLPLYPFERERYWVETDSSMDESLPIQTNSSRHAVQGIRAYLLELLSSLLALKVEKIQVDQKFDKYGMDSLVALRMIKAIENTYGVSVTLAEFFDCFTIEKLERVLLEKGAAPHTKTSFDYYLSNMLLSCIEEGKLSLDTTLKLKEVVTSFVERGEMDDRA
ncbi:SDR family NAD(P)-dependent oxidoreductase [Paenibacillus sp. 1-18]|uniref:SDR family NAD(P)-dependent oxidoreductase n=1 Tax=Paenibacillus sp. 1-18 TaxID=1333846 RepID=UPI00046F080D|nr:SDR family NAD(P)-dependent oxidoreductase [Paenibacillus sp. 1-18]